MIKHCTFAIFIATMFGGAASAEIYHCVEGQGSHFINLEGKRFARTPREWAWVDTGWVDICDKRAPIQFRCSYRDGGVQAHTRMSGYNFDTSAMTLTVFEEDPVQGSGPPRVARCHIASPPEKASLPKAWHRF